MTKSTQNRPNRPGQTVVRQKALIAAIRAAIAGGVFVQPAMAAEHSPLPVPVQAMDHLGRLGNVNAALNAAGNKMTINQLTNKAIIDWKSFDIDHGYAVQFKQPNAASVALNNIGNTGSPSQIFGSLSANGQIYLVNQNGFVFGKGSQVNASALVATSLGISDDAFKRGITKVFDQTKNAALKGDSEVFIKDEAGNYVLDKNHQKIPIRIFVQDGATITGAKDAKGAVEAGNRVILAAPVVDNEGTIKTPEGQTILAAAQDKVYLQEANGDPNLRGLLVEVGTGGTVENVGKVLADRGNASLIGFAVTQNGLVSATSSVSLNGSVRLLAREGLATTEGKKGPVIIGASNVRGDGSKPEDHATVKLGVNSVTQVLPDADKSATAVDAQ
ncbi:MAG: filamentous hemagglutinin N-terminal domain-containing protein, partial [Methylococcaceae bacterium]|nr:filamentous hemagglutinin N-terminal domain-containing protein [Methylococcaceae bacterium]